MYSNLEATRRKNIAELTDDIRKLKRQHSFGLLKDLERLIPYAIGRVGNMDDMPDVSDADHAVIQQALHIVRRIYQDYEAGMKVVVQDDGSGNQVLANGRVLR